MLFLKVKLFPLINDFPGFSFAGTSQTSKRGLGEMIFKEGDGRDDFKRKYTPLLQRKNNNAVKNLI